MGDATTIPRKTRIQAQNEELILKAALEAFSAYGFRGATVDQIAARYGMPFEEMVDPTAAVGLIAGYLADLATALVLLHAPDRLVFGGGVMKAPGMLAALRRETELRLGKYVSGPAGEPGLENYIVAPGLGDLAGITGAVALGRMSVAQERARS